jgi:hypothetical protein
MMKTAPNMDKSFGDGVKKVSKWQALKQKTSAAQALGVLNTKFAEPKPHYRKRQSSMVSCVHVLFSFFCF